MAVRYQVFISSTFDDLQEERAAAIKAVLEMGHIPVGMEMFSAADEEQWQIIARHIDESDYYCVILAHRYGSEIDGVSYTRKEYEYAASKKIPVLGFVIDGSADWPATKVDKGTATVRKLDEFKARVRQKPVSTWSNAGDLYGKVSIALGKQITANPREGWIRASAAAGPEVTAELTRLSAENARLRDELIAAQEESEHDRIAEYQALWQRMYDLTRVFSYRLRPRDPWKTSKPIPYVQIFDQLAPQLAYEGEINDLASTLCMQIREEVEEPWDTVATNQLKDFLADLMALNLAHPSTRKHAVADKGEYWSLTEYGTVFHGWWRGESLQLKLSKTENAKTATKAKKAPSKSPAKRPARKKVAETKAEAAGGSAR